MLGNEASYVSGGPSYSGGIVASSDSSGVTLKQHIGKMIEKHMGEDTAWAIDNTGHVVECYYCEKKQDQNILYKFYQKLDQSGKEIAAVAKAYNRVTGAKLVNIISILQDDGNLYSCIVNYMEQPQETINQGIRSVCYTGKNGSVEITSGVTECYNNITGEKLYKIISVVLQDEYRINDYYINSMGNITKLDFKNEQVQPPSLLRIRSIEQKQNPFLMHR